MQPLQRDEALKKLKVERYRLQSALDRFYSHDLSGDPVAMEAEALDVSTPIRVMVHLTGSSASLLSQIDPEYWNKLIHFSPLIAPPPRTLESGVQTITQVVPLNIKMGMKTTSFIRYKGDNNPNSKAPLSSWWSDPCWDNGGANKISNKEMVLALSNKEGGAHVDGDVTAVYKAAKEQGRIVIGGRPVSDVARLGNLVGVAGDELLEYLRDNFPEN